MRTEFEPVRSAPFITAAGRTHVGCIRTVNEDCFAIGVATTSTGVEAIGPVSSSGDSVLVVVADGLGGHPHGERASREAADAIVRARPSTTDALVEATMEANVAMYAAMSAEAQLTGMGTTVAALLVRADGVSVVNVGDSAAFEFDRHRLVQLSTDDVPSGSGRVPGVPTSVVTQTLGGSRIFSPIDPHVYEDDALLPRRFLVCTDGLTNFVPGAEIREALTDTSPDVACELLVERALAAGAPDNVTVIVLDADWVR